jgi:hypothetical protein
MASGNNGNNEPPTLEYRHELEPIVESLNSKMRVMREPLLAIAPRCTYFIIGGYSLYQYEFNHTVLNYEFLKTNDIDFQIIVNEQRQTPTILNSIDNLVVEHGIKYIENHVQYFLEDITEETLKTKLKIENVIWDPTDKILYESNALDLLISNNNSTIDLYVEYQKSLGEDASNLDGLLKSSPDSMYPKKEFAVFNIMHMYVLLLLLINNKKSSTKYVKSAKIIARMLLLLNTPEESKNERDNIVTVFYRTLNDIHVKINKTPSIDKDIYEITRITSRIISKIQTNINADTELKSQFTFLIQQIPLTAYEFLGSSRSLMKGGGMNSQSKIDIDYLKRYFPNDLLYSSDEEVTKYWYDKTIHEVISKQLNKCDIKSVKSECYSSLFSKNSTKTLIGGYKSQKKSRSVTKSKISHKKDKKKYKNKNKK